MIKSLQRRFILISMGSFTGVVLIIIIAINLVMTSNMNSHVDGLLSTLAEHEGRFPELSIPGDAGPPPDRRGGFKMTEETRFETRYFLIRLDHSGSVFEIDTGHIAAISSGGAGQYAVEVLERGKTSGYIDTYKYKLAEKEYGSLIIFLDCRNDIELRQSVLEISAIVAVLSFLVILALVTALSGMAIRPVERSIESQRRFITDAGHEIKTPLAIISANTDVLEISEGANEWTQSIKNQTARLDKLVQDLIKLSRLEEGGSPELVELDLSAVVSETAASFEVMADNLSLDIQSGLHIKGDGHSISELVTILVDNAVKYCSEGGNVRVRLSLHERRPRLSVANTMQTLPDCELDRLFDRFYRADGSRSRETGGYGIGLSIARAIAEAHRAKIGCRALGEQEIEFYVEF